MLACSSSSCLRKPRQAFSLVFSYLNRPTSTVRDDPPPLITRVQHPRFFSSASSSFPSKKVAISSPWLMLTPEIELSSGVDTVFKFYSLAEDRVISTDPRNLKAQLGLEPEVEVDLKCWGSSHGWLVLFDRGSSDLFLYNPLSNRHLKLPTMHKLDGLRYTKKVIISSPDPEGDVNCRALMLHGHWGNLLFCRPSSSSSSEWTETHSWYEDVACCAGYDNLFLGVNDEKPPSGGSSWNYPEFEGWDLKDVSRPTLISLEDRLVKEFGTTFPWKGYGSRKKGMGRDANYLVSAADDVYYVCLKSVNRDLNYDGDYHFHVHKFDFESGKLVHMDGSLDGLAFFVGRSHCFALSAAEFPELEPDSIYFTHLENCDSDELGTNQMKAYNYRDCTFSPPFYTLNENISWLGKPMWYTPTCAAAALF